MMNIGCGGLTGGVTGLETERGCSQDREDECSVFRLAVVRSVASKMNELTNTAPITINNPTPIFFRGAICKLQRIGKGMREQDKSVNTETAGIGNSQLCSRIIASNQYRLWRNIQACTQME
jgi:hypothetical protein